MIMSEKIGETFVRQGIMKDFQVKNILLRQQHGDVRLFGEIAVDLRYLPEKSLDRYLINEGLPLWSGDHQDKKNMNFSVQSFIAKTGLVG